MSNQTLAVMEDVQALLAKWVDAERNGEQFPVPFEMAWRMAGYTTKGNAKRKLESFLDKGSDYLSEMIKTSRDGRPLEDIRLSCDALKQLCMVSKTETGRETRLYFIEAEKNWKIVQQIAPEIAAEAELVKLKTELARQEAIKAKAEQATVELRYYVATTLPEPVQQKVFGHTEIRQVEYRDRIIYEDDIVRDGSTINKTDICKRLGILTRNGSPDFKALNRFLESLGLPDECWVQTKILREAQEISREFFPEIEHRWKSATRQGWIGE
jgi:phage anti-repressor protein